MIDHFTIIPSSTILNKVAAIKALRSLAFLGLKESKDAVEMVGVAQTFKADSSASAAFQEEQFRTLRNNGIEVQGTGMFIVEELRKLGAQALLQGEDELANEILQLVLAEKLRRAK